MGSGDPKYNPVAYWDPDGQKVVFAPGVSEQFKKDFAKTVQFMNSKGTSGMLSQLHKSNNIYYVNSTSKASNSFNPKNSTISWNSRLAKITTNYKSLSPATLLNHEIDHALRYDTNPQQFVKDAYKSQGGADSQYDTKEERRVIQGSEQVTALKHGDIGIGEITRTDHKMAAFISVDDPTSNGENTIVGKKKSKRTSDGFRDIDKDLDDFEKEVEKEKRELEAALVDLRNTFPDIFD